MQTSHISYLCLHQPACSTSLPPSLPPPSLPPSQQLASKSLNLLSLPYYPWAKFNWSMYPLHAPSDLLAGLTVGIMLVPQGRTGGGGGGGGGGEREGRVDFGFF